MAANDTLAVHLKSVMGDVCSHLATLTRRNRHLSSINLLCSNSLQSTVVHEYSDVTWRPTDARELWSIVVLAEGACAQYNFTDVLQCTAVDLMNGQLFSVCSQLSI